MPHTSAHAADDALPPLDTRLGREEILSVLELAARRGRIPGLVTGPRAGASLFAIEDFGTPFESLLLAQSEPIAAGGTRLTWTMRMKQRMPAVFLLTLILTVWPGVWLTDSMLRTYFDWYRFQTWMWYIPLTAPFVPLALRTAVRRSKASGLEEAHRLISKVREALADAPTPQSGRSDGTGLNRAGITS